MIPALVRRVNALGLLTFVGAFVLWEVVVRTRIIDFDYVPPPSAVASSGLSLLRTGELQENLVHTLTATLVGWVLACLVGVVIGTLLGVLRPVWTYSMASFDALRSLPIVAFVPVAVLLFGFTLKMEIVVAFYAALWPVLLNTLGGMRAVKPRLLEVARVMGMSRTRELWSVRLPVATPFIVTGMRLGLAISLVLTLVAEMVGNPAGLGFALIQKAQVLQPEAMFAYIVAVGFAGIVLNAMLVLLVTMLFRGQMAAAGDAT